MILKQKEILNKLADERLEEITELDNKVNPDNLIYKYKGPTAVINFNKFGNALSLVDKIRGGEMSLSDVNSI